MILLAFDPPGRGPWIRAGVGAGWIPSQCDITVLSSGASRSALVVRDLDVVGPFDDCGHEGQPAALIALGYTGQRSRGLTIGPELSFVGTAPYRGGFRQITAGLRNLSRILRHEGDHVY
jgi:hypothetical protein